MTHIDSRGNSRRIASAAIAAVLGFGIAQTDAVAKQKIADGGNVATCSVQGVFGAIPTNGAVSVPIGVYDPSVFDAVRGGNCDPTTFSGFSINIEGTSYSSVFVNENGIVSFGASIGASPATALFELATPAFAPFFADGFLPNDAALEFGYTDASVGLPNSFWLTWNALLPEGNPGATPNIFQLGIVDLGGGDFDLILNYEQIAWDSATIGAQAGITNGLGAYFLLAGAGVPGAYLGFDDTSSGSSVCNSATPATALACNAINDGSQVVGGQDANTGLPSNGYYLFKFRNGVLVDPVPSQVPLPAAFWLFVAGAGVLFGRRALKR